MDVALERAVQQEEHCARTCSVVVSLDHGQARAAAHPQSAHDHPATKRSKRARLRHTVGHDEHQRARFKERWACSARVAPTAPMVIPNS